MAAFEGNQKGMGKLEEFYQKNKNIINGAFIVVLLGVGYYIYSGKSKASENEEAAPKIAQAQSYFQIDSLNKALYGDGVNLGFVDIAADYSGTATGELANFYAGISFLKMGEYDQAIERLDDFDGEGELEARKEECLGHAYAQKGDVKSAKSHYLKAVSASENDFVKPYFLKLAADYHRMNSDLDKAAQLYRQLAKEYPTSQEGREAEKFLAFSSQSQ